ncbi:hypothetical protein OA57_11725 [Chelonobacter oris]|uniref:CRISPR-associated protein n=1 Tax=Chelonobacter oris TaxID=505317 RepID=A0A0A3B735_9PAST|nr:type I-F CRISPR-associated protein Csy1 [Chelonobacter oris]KGQ69419.1 hypothetical protein OA57_11725 [Chelonobacter oris]
MEQITPEQVKSAVQAFLTARYERETEKERNQLENAKAAEDWVKISRLETLLLEAKTKYSLTVWMKNAAERMAKQLQFGTHISKGVHPDAKGDNVNYRTDRTLPAGFVGSQSIDSVLLDANGNAAALPLAALFDVNLGKSNIKLRTLIIQDSPLLDGVFADDATLSARYQALFKTALVSELAEPTTHERNKQLLFPTATGDYHVIVPLYPSVLTHELYQRIIKLRFSDENKAARDNRFKKNVEQKAYISIPNIAITKLGGTKPQNVSQLMNKQGGRNYLLPSLPPHFAQQSVLSIGAKTDSIFSRNLTVLCQKPLQALFKIVETDYNNVHIRDARKAILDDILRHLCTAAREIQTARTAGWTIDIALNYAEKLWLDPYRTELEDQAQFKRLREEGGWRDEIAKRFADWLNSVLKHRFKEIKQDFADPEHNEWRREIEEMIKESQLLGKAVFQ